MAKFFKIILVLSSATIIAASAMAEVASVEAVKTGSLYVYSKIGFLSVYVDNDFVGETPVEMDNVKAGTHLVTATLNNQTVHEEVATVREGEVTTILVEREPEKPKEETKSPIPSSSSSSDKNSSGGKNGMGAIYGKLGYMTSYNYSYNPDFYGVYYSSSLMYGLGFKLNLDKYVGILLDLSRADFGSPDANWYIMPATINFQLGYPISPGFGGLNYYSLGIGYYFTNLESSDGNNLSCLGFNIASGLEFPIGDGNSVFIEVSNSLAENGKAEFDMESTVIAFGYRGGI